MKLSDRLQLIADEIKVGETMADIGCDHGFLPIYLMSEKKCPKAIMTDISEGSLQKAKDNCMEIGVPDQYIMQRGGWSSDNVMKSVYRNVIDLERY